MIAPLRTDTDETNTLFSEPRRIGELLPELLAKRGIQLPKQRESDRRQLDASRADADRRLTG